VLRDFLDEGLVIEVVNGFKFPGLAGDFEG
jgi:hypothetical protein